MKISTPFLACLLATCAAAAPAQQEPAHAAKAVHGSKQQKPWGVAGDAKAVKRTVEITMTDNMRFSPDFVQVQQGETVRFTIKNAGKMMHELVIGTKQQLDEHAALMMKSPSMDHGRQPDMIHVAPGKKGDLVWNFNRAGDFDFACLIPGHYQAGMVGKIRVAASGKS